MRRSTRRTGPQRLRRVPPSTRLRTGLVDVPLRVWRWIFGDRRLFGRFNGLFNLFLRRFQFCLNGPHLRINRVPHVSRGFTEGSEGACPNLRPAIAGRRQPGRQGAWRLWPASRHVAPARVPRPFYSRWLPVVFRFAWSRPKKEPADTAPSVEARHLRHAVPWSPVQTALDRGRRSAPTRQQVETPVAAVSGAKPPYTCAAKVPGVRSGPGCWACGVAG